MQTDNRVTLSEAAEIVGISRQTLWEWAKKEWIKPLKSVSKTGGRPAQLFSALEIIRVAEKRMLLSSEQAERLKKRMTS